MTTSTTAAAHRNIIRNFEVLRSDGSDYALSVNKGLLSDTPDAIREQGGSLQFLSATGAEIGWIEAVPKEIVDAVNSDIGLLFFEFDRSGKCTEYEFRNVDLNPLPPPVLCPSSKSS